MKPTHPLAHTARTPLRPRRFASIALAAGLALSALWSPANAQAILLLPDVCDDPAATFDARWAQARHGATTTYLMQANGTVQHVDGAQPNGFDGFNRLYIASHGGAGTIDGMSHANFAAHLHAAHASTPDTVVFAVCSAAAGPNGLLKQVNDRYGGQVRRLEGGTTGCRLTGNGNQNLAVAEYRTNAGTSNAQLNATIVGNIVAKWGQPYPGSPHSYAAVCNAVVGNAAFNPAAMRAFLATVYAQFTQPAPPLAPNQSTNYLQLVGLNTGGNPLSVCGANPNLGGPVACL